MAHEAIHQCKHHAHVLLLAIVLVCTYVSGYEIGLRPGKYPGSSDHMAGWDRHFYWV